MPKFTVQVEERVVSEYEVEAASDEAAARDAMELHLGAEKPLNVTYHVTDRRVNVEDEDGNESTPIDEWE